MTGPPWPTRYPGATWRPVRNTSGAMVQPIRGLIPHVQVGNGSLYGMFNNPASQVSSHLWVAKSGALEQYVDLTRKAWAQASGNPYWISVECEGGVAEDYTAAQLARLGEIYAWGMGVYGWPAQITDSPDVRGLGAHRMGGNAWGGHSCPGDLRLGRRADILAAARGLTGGVSASTNGDDVELAELNRVATGEGKHTFGETVIATCKAAETAVNRATAAGASAKAAADSGARIEALLGSLSGSGSLPQPVTLDDLKSAAASLPRGDVAALLTYCAVLLAGATGGS